MILKVQPRQSQVFHSKADEILYGGAAFGGKSYLMRIAAISACSAIPGLNVFIFRRTYGELEFNHVLGSGGFLELLGDLMSCGAVRYRSMKDFSFPNGSMIHLCHCQHDKDKLKYQGADLHWLLIDELTHFTEEVYRYLRGRVRLGGLKIPDTEDAKRFRVPFILSGTNPGGVGHAWVKNAFISRAKPFELVRQSEEEGGMLRQFIPALLEDNPLAEKSDPGYASRLIGLGSAHLVQAMRWGNWDIIAGGALADIWNNDIHILDPFDIPSGWKVDRGFDWGSSHPFAVLWFAESDGRPASIGGGKVQTFPAGTVFVIAEWYGWNGKPNEGLRMVSYNIAEGIVARDGEFPFRVEPGPADSAIYAMMDGHCIADEMSRAGCTWIPCVKGPGSRTAGLQRVRQMLYNARTGADRPGLYVFSTCEQFLRTVPPIQGDPYIDDTAKGEEDHNMDTLRYRVSGFDSGAVISPLRV